MAQSLASYTGTLEQVKAQIAAEITRRPNGALLSVSLVSAPGQEPGPGWVCLCVWK